MNMEGIGVLLILVVVVAAVALIEASLSVLIALKDKQKNKLICGNQTHKLKTYIYNRENNHIKIFFMKKAFEMIKRIKKLLEVAIKSI